MHCQCVWEVLWTCRRRFVGVLWGCCQRRAHTLRELATALLPLLLLLLLLLVPTVCSPLLTPFRLPWP